MLKAAIHIAQKSGILILLFLLSPIDTSYGATECVLLSTQGCAGMTMRCAGSHGCCEKSCPKVAARRMKEASSRKTCPLKYSVTKTFDPAVTGKTRKTVSTAATVAFAVLHANSVPTLAVHRLVSPAASPPDIVILQRNLRI
jgi:hypothetical protein